MFDKKSLVFCGVCLVVGLATGQMIYAYKKQQDPIKSTVAIAKHPKANFKSWYNGKSAPVSELNGQSNKEIVDLMGPPKMAEVLNVKNGLLEYQKELYNLFPKGTDVELRELLFVQNFEDKTLNLYIWLKEKKEKFIVVHSLLHDDNTEF